MRVSLPTGVTVSSEVEDRELFRRTFFLPCRSECYGLCVCVCVIEVLVFECVSWCVTVMCLHSSAVENGPVSVWSKWKHGAVRVGLPSVGT